jgi:hypothetical protein
MAALIILPFNFQPLMRIEYSKIKRKVNIFGAWHQPGCSPALANPWRIMFLNPDFLGLWLRQRLDELSNKG